MAKAVRRQTYVRFLRQLISLPEWTLSQVFKIALERVYLTKFNVQSAQYWHNRPKRGSLVKPSHKINILRFQLVYDIEHLNSQSPPVIDLNRPSTVSRSARSCENKGTGPPEQNGGKFQRPSPSSIRPYLFTGSESGDI